LIAGRGCDVGALQDAGAGWITKYDNLVELLDDGTLDGPKSREKAAKYKEIAAIDAQLAAATRISPTAAPTGEWQGAVQEVGGAPPNGAQPDHR
jgi:hypothetical protein